MSKVHKQRKIAIVGTAPASRGEAPYDDPTWEIWGCSNAMDLPRITRWYELHNLDRKAVKDSDYFQKLTQLRPGQDHPVYVTHPDARLPTAAEFPYEAVAAQRGYFCSQVDLMIGHALLEHAAGKRVAELGLWGIDMAQNTEYQHQRKSAEYWLGRCEGLGLAVHIPSTSPLLKSRGVYGIDDASDEFAALYHARISELARRQAGIRAMTEQATIEVNKISGQLLEVDRWLRAANNGQQSAYLARREELASLAQAAVQRRNQLQNDEAVLIGAQENMRWISQLGGTGDVQQTPAA